MTNIFTDILEHYFSDEVINIDFKKPLILSDKEIDELYHFLIGQHWENLDLTYPRTTLRKIAT